MSKKALSKPKYGLYFDFGNSAVKWKIHVGACLIHGQSLYTPRLAQQLKSDWARAQRLSVSSDPSAVYTLAYCSVASKEVTDPVLSLATQLTQATPLQVRPVRQLSLVLPSGTILIKNGYKRPTQLGADRWLSVLGIVAQLHDSPERHRILKKYRPSMIGHSELEVCLVSAGTATVIDRVELHFKDKTSLERVYFKGGVILPGIGLMRQVLGQETHGLGSSIRQKPMTARRSVNQWPLETSEAINQGIATAQSAWLLLKPAPSIILIYGGHAHEWQKFFQTNAKVFQERTQTRFSAESFIVPNPVLDGLELAVS